MPIYLIDKIKQKNGKTFKLLDAADVGTADGKSVEERLLNVTEKFKGSTESNTPTEVVNELAKGNTVLISHTDSTYGILMFANFAVASGMNFIAASVIVENEGTMLNAGLMGYLGTDEWEFSVKPLEAEEKVATEVDLSGFETEGKIVETFEDGSTNTYIFVDDTANNSTTITDSKGNSTVIKGMNVGLAVAEEASF